MDANSMKWLGPSLVLSLMIAIPVYAKSPYEKPDDTWISISGTVDTIDEDAFTLDYGEGLITVEMDDGDRDADGYKLRPNDKVTVNGMVDDDFFEVTTIEASSVYVEDIGTYFYASSADEEDTFVTMDTPVTVSSTVLQGKVTEVNEESFMLDTGEQQIEVFVDSMPYDPLDDKGYQKIEEGDRVSVAGDIDDEFMEEQQLSADSVVTLSEGSS